MEKCRILAHRGWWKQIFEKNSLIALNRAIENGFGIETDFRDYNGKLVISHDPVGWGNKQFIDAEDWVKELPINHGYLALNIKSDGLSTIVEDILKDSNYKRLFVFDMSIPETVRYAKSSLPYYVRQSEIEREPILNIDNANHASGIWLDAFVDSNWYDLSLLSYWLDKNVHVCLVSPELHGRDHKSTWEKILKSGVYKHPKFMLCTDLPMDASNYFSAKSRVVACK
jgi:hypothetical protein